MQITLPKELVVIGRKKIEGHHVLNLRASGQATPSRRHIIESINRSTREDAIIVIETGGTAGQIPKMKKHIVDGKPVWTEVFVSSGKPVTPLVRGIEDHATVLIHEIPKLIDSTKMTTLERAMIAEIIYKYEIQPPTIVKDGKRTKLRVRGYVIIHGTDTMVHTGAALTYMLKGFGKPIVLTGAQIPIVNPTSDATKNITRAVQVAMKNVGEVVIAFGDNLLRATRAVKYNEEAANAFETPRRANLGNLGIFAQLDVQVIPANKNFIPYLFPFFDDRAEIIVPPSGARTQFFKTVLENPEIKGVVVVGYGAGNVDDIYAPDMKKILDTGKNIVVVTESSQGRADMTMYGAGAAAIDNRIISGGDMTPAVALQKLFYARGLLKEERIPEKESHEFVNRIMSSIINDDRSAPRAEDYQRRKSR